MKGIAEFFKTLLTAIVLIGPSFQGIFSDAFSVAPVTLKSSHMTRRGITSSPPFSDVPATKFRPRSFHEMQKCKRTTSPSSTTSLFMYNLPPGGGGGNDNSLADIAKGALSIALVIGFFASPLGGLVLGIFNSFLVFLFVAPLLAGFAIQLWQKLNTIQGDCPSCGVPVTVLKNKDVNSVVNSAPAPQSRCFACGAFLEPNADNTGINNVTGKKTVNDQMNQMSSLFDLFSGSPSPPTESWSTTTTGSDQPTPTSSSSKKSGPKGIDKNAVIDVDVLDEDKPFQ